MEDFSITSQHHLVYGQRRNMINILSKKYILLFFKLPRFPNIIRKDVASLRPDHLPTLSAAKTSKLSLLVKHHILAIDEAS